MDFNSVLFNLAQLGNRIWFAALQVNPSISLLFAVAAATFATWAAIRMGEFGVIGKFAIWLGILVISFIAMIAAAHLAPTFFSVSGLADSQMIKVTPDQR